MGSSLRTHLIKLVALSCIVATNQSIADVSNSVELSLSQLSGSTDYQIGGLVQLADGTSGYVEFPISKLEFPSDMSLLGIGLILQREHSLITARISSSVEESTTTMKDSDWGLTVPGALDIYSESENDGDMQMLDLRYAGISRPKYSNFTGYLGIGLLMQKYHFDVHDGTQTYPSTGLPDDPLPGSLLTYDLDVTVPYGFVRVEREASDSGLSWYIELAASPIAAVEDEDHHLLRDKVNKGTYDGSATIYDIGMTYRGSSNFSVALSYKRTKIDTEGEQDSSFSGVYNHTIEAENTSDHELYSLSVSVLF
jgi:hypothetical protein